MKIESVVVRLETRDNEGIRKLTGRYGSLAKFAKTFNLDRTRLTKALRGQTGISLEYLNKILRPFGLEARLKISVEKIEKTVVSDGNGIHR